MLLNYNIQYRKDDEAAITPADLIELYLYGIPICTTTHKELSYDTIKQKILVAQREIETLLNIKLAEQMIRETTNFIRNEWNSWGYCRTSYNIKEAVRMEGFYNNILQISYPRQWLNIRRENSSVDYDRDVIFRNVYIVPSGSVGNPRVNGVTFNGLTPWVGFLGYQYVPNYWAVTYVTGFQKIPIEIVDAVGKLAAIQILAILGDVFMGVGMSSFSVNLDGLSQSTSLIKSGEYGIYGARITQYLRDLYGDSKKTTGLFELLKGKYRSLNFDVC